MESSELLREFVELAPREWALGVSGGLRFCGLPTGNVVIWYYPNETTGEMMFDDRHSSEAIIFLWDYLEGCYGGFVGFNCASIGKVTEMWVVVHMRDAPLHPPAPTRIEALVRACVAYWKENEL